MESKFEQPDQKLEKSQEILKSAMADIEQGGIKVGDEIMVQLRSQEDSFEKDEVSAMARAWDTKVGFYDGLEFIPGQGVVLTINNNSLVDGTPLEKEKIILDSYENFDILSNYRE
ncbi:MAG: hypothetical protein WC791_02040 [Candidatus Paceibacterota bacterium]|jgi:hypothetical protein